MSAMLYKNLLMLLAVRISSYGSLESTQEARVALGCASRYSYASFVLSKVPANRRAFCMRMRASAERQWRGRIKSDGGKIENSRKVTVLLKAISLVL